MSFKVLVTDKINEIAVKILQDTCDVDYKPVLAAAELKAVIKDYDAVMIRSSSRITRDIIAGADRLKIIGRATAENRRHIQRKVRNLEIEITEIHTQKIKRHSVLCVFCGLVDSGSMNRLIY